MWWSRVKNILECLSRYWGHSVCLVAYWFSSKTLIYNNRKILHGYLLSFRLRNTLCLHKLILRRPTSFLILQKIQFLSLSLNKFHTTKRSLEVKYHNVWKNGKWYDLIWMYPSAQCRLSRQWNLQRCYKFCCSVEWTQGKMFRNGEAFIRKRVLYFTSLCLILGRNDGHVVG